MKLRKEGMHHTYRLLPTCPELYFTNTDPLDFRRGFLRVKEPFCVSQRKRGLNGIAKDLPNISFTETNENLKTSCRRKKKKE